METIDAILPVIMGATAVAQMIHNHQLQRQQEHANQASAERQMSFQKEQTGTSYQRAVEDMKKAGLNPALAYQQGGANSASGASATAAPTNPTDLSKIATSAADSTRLSQAQTALQSQTALNAAQGTAAVASAKLSDSTALKNMIESEALRAELPARKSEAIFRKEKANIDTKAVEYDAIINRLGQVGGIVSDATSAGRLLKNLKSRPRPSGEPGKITPAIPPGQKPPPVHKFKLERDGDRIGKTPDGHKFNMRTGEIYD